MIHNSCLFILFTILIYHCQLTSSELQPYEQIKQQIFPFELGNDAFNEHMEDLFRDVSRKKSLPITSLAFLVQDQNLLKTACHVYDETKQDPVVQKAFTIAKNASFNGCALWEWQTACHTVNKTLQEKIREFNLHNANMKKSDLELIMLLAHFAFQQNKYIIEQQICKKLNREHTHRWFSIHKHKGKL